MDLKSKKINNIIHFFTLRPIYMAHHDWLVPHHPIPNIKFPPITPPNITS